MVPRGCFAVYFFTFAKMERPTDRQERVSWWRQSSLEQAHVAVIGAGALGNEVLKNLALMGFGNIDVFDFDLVETSNLSRTVLFGPDCLGQPKALVAASKAKELNVNRRANVTGHHLDVVWDLGAGTLRRMDLVLGCLDNLEARLAIGRVCYQLGVPLIDGGMRELSGRIQLHLTGSGACMDCTIGSSERSALTARYSCLNVLKSYVSENIIPTVQVTSAIIAGMMCQEGVKILQGQAVQFGHVLSWIGEKGNYFDVLRMIRRNDCYTCRFSPIRPLIELPLAAMDTGHDITRIVGSGWRIQLPSPFVTSFLCGLCGEEYAVAKPAHRCRSAELYCKRCDTVELIELRTLEYLSSTTPADILGKTMSELGIPPLAILAGSSLYAAEDSGEAVPSASAGETRLFELSSDDNTIFCRKEL